MSRAVKVGRFRLVVLDNRGPRWFYAYRSSLRGGTCFAGFGRFRIWRDGR